MLPLRTSIAMAVFGVGLLGAASSPVFATVDSTDAIRDLAGETAELVTREQALLDLVRADADVATDDQLRAVDEAGSSALRRLELMGVTITPATRSVLEPLPRQPDSTSALINEIVPPGVVYDAAITDLLRVAATPEAVAPVAATDSGLSFGLLAVAAVSLVALGLVTLATTLRQRADDAELAAMVWSDGLTGLANRRRLDHDLAGYRGTESMTAAIMVDVDHFKTVNDSYGHGIGDDVLRQVATMLTHHVRYDDVVYRYGGEEFCILLPDASIDDARTVAARIVEAARTIVLPDASNITISVGVADGATDVSQVVATADRALYEAKLSGRDCAVTATTAELTNV